ncbi:hypothetical protein N2152v2_004651 [Parachlorella kessleri]
MTEAPSVPVVDLGWAEEQAAKAVHDACVRYGFLYVTNHGVPEELIKAHFDMQQRFFSLPLEQKMTILADANNRGYTPLGEETLDPERSKAPDTHEGLYYCREVPPDSEEAKLPLHGPNQWPAEELVPGYRAVVQQYFDAVTALGMRMLRLLALSLGLPPGYFHPFFTRPMLALRPLHYSATPSRPQDGLYGAGAHSDYGMLTFLATDGVPGLQICPDRATGEWVDVPPLEGCYIVNLGDMLERWTNGVYRSTLHRVVNLEGRERYSAAFFFEPNFDTCVEPLPQCCSEDRPAKYPPTTSGQWLLHRYRATHSGYADQKAATGGSAA